MSGTQKSYLGLIPKSWSEWNLNNLTEISLEIGIFIWNFKVTTEVQNKTSSIKLKCRIYQVIPDQGNPQKRQAMFDHFNHSIMATLN